MVSASCATAPTTAGERVASDPDKPTAKSPGPAEAPKGPGGVHHDARGNAVWQWAVDSGKQALDSTSRLLKRLEVPGLKLEEDATKDASRDAPGPAAGLVAAPRRHQARGEPAGCAA